MLYKTLLFLQLIPFVCLSQDNNQVFDEILSSAQNAYDLRKFEDCDIILSPDYLYGSQELSPKSRVELFILKGRAKAGMFQADSATHYYHQGIKLLGDRHFDETIARIYYYMAYPFKETGKLDSALVYINWAIELDSANQYRHRYFEDLKRKSAIYFYFGQTEEALAVLDQALDWSKNYGLTDVEQEILLRKGRIYMNVDEFEEAESMMNQSLELAKAQNDIDAESRINYRKTILYMRWNKYDLADSVNREARTQADSILHPIRYGNLLAQAARIRVETNNADSAEYFVEQASNYILRLGYKGSISNIFLIKSRLLTVKEDYNGANIWIDSALHYSKDFYDPLIRIGIYHQKARVALYLDDQATYLEYQNKYNMIEDSLLGMDNLRAVHANEIKETQEQISENVKSMEGELADVKKGSHLNLLIGIVIGLLGIMTAILIFLNIHKKLRLKEDQIVQEQQQYQEAILAKEQEIEIIKEEGVQLKKLPEHFEPLSNREKDVFQLLVQGLSDKEISEELFISLPTVRTHTRHIYEKFHINSRMEAKDISLKYNVLED